MGRYFETKQQECFGVALANYMMRYGGIWGEKLPSPQELLDRYWREPFVQCDGVTDAFFVPYLTRSLTGGMYDAKVTVTRNPDYDMLIQKYGGGIGLLLADEGRRGNIRQVERIAELEVPCIAILENSIDIVGSDEKYHFNPHAVLALGHHWYIDFGQLLHYDDAQVIGAVHLSLLRNPLKELCEARGIKVEMPEPNIWRI